MSILVVDDDDDIREAIKEVLEHEGYSATGASNGHEALQALARGEVRPSLILLDLMMPEMDGWEFLRRIDDEPGLHRIPVALMSAHPSVRRAFVKDAGGTASRLLLPKPLHLLRLLATVRDVCAAAPPESGDSGASADSA